jgi:preprotein translocase subunit SecY
VALIVLIVGMVLIICFMERAQRRLLIQYPKRASQRGMMQADRSHLPLKMNTAGVIPPIFASFAAAAAADRSPSLRAIRRGRERVGRFCARAEPVSQPRQPVYMALYASALSSSASSTPPWCSIPRRRRRT